MPGVRLAYTGRIVERLLAHPMNRYTAIILVEAEMMEAANVKEEARRLVEKLPDDASWDDLMHEIYVRQAIEAGLEDSRAGRLSSLEDVRSKLGLSQA